MRTGRPQFEAAADAVHDGDLDALVALLDAHPELPTMRSHRDHHATLVHYVACNGIELERQQHSPPNAPAILNALFERGADPDATCDLYDGGPNQTALCLTVSSVHPHNAGVQAALVTELVRGGANRVPVFNATAVGAARYHHRDEIVTLLENP